MLKINNPCNIRFSTHNHWKGQIGSSKGFVYFCSLFYGYRAFLVLLRNYSIKYHITTISSFIQKFAPSTENPSSSYSSFLVGSLAKHGFSDTIVFSVDYFYWLAYYVTIFENGVITEDCICSLHKVCDVYKSLILHD